MKTTGLTGMIPTACLCLYQGVQNFGKLCIFKVPHILFKMFSWGVSKIILDKISNGQHRFIFIISPTVLKKIIPQFYSLIMIIWSWVCLCSQSPVLSVNNLYLYLLHWQVPTSARSWTRRPWRQPMTRLRLLPWSTWTMLWISSWWVSALVQTYLMLTISKFWCRLFSHTVYL